MAIFFAYSWVLFSACVNRSHLELSVHFGSSPFLHKIFFVLFSASLLHALCNRYVNYDACTVHSCRVIVILGFCAKNSVARNIFTTYWFFLMGFGCRNTIIKLVLELLIFGMAKISSFYFTCCMYSTLSPFICPYLHILRKYEISPKSREALWDLCIFCYQISFDEFGTIETL